MTFEELKAEADRQGYYLEKKKVYTRLLPCVCGKKRINLWRLSNGVWVYICPNCGRESQSSKTQIGAKKNWNELMNHIKTTEDEIRKRREMAERKEE